MAKSGLNHVEKSANGEGVVLKFRRGVVCEISDVRKLLKKLKF